MGVIPVLAQRRVCAETYTELRPRKWMSTQLTTTVALVELCTAHSQNQKAAMAKC